MKLAKWQEATFELSKLYGISIVARTENGELIISNDLEAKLEEVHSLVKKKIEQVSIKREGAGRPKIVTPPASELRAMQDKGMSISKIAKTLKIDRKTVRNRLNQ